jgi:DNA-binding CsgD family transcriptional regulator
MRPIPATLHLSPRERQTLLLMLGGLSEKQMAARLGITKHTLHVYVKSLYRLYGAESRGELMAGFVCPHKRKAVDLGVPAVPVAPRRRRGLAVVAREWKPSPA